MASAAQHHNTLEAGVNPIVIVMGITASGKTTVARKLAERLGWRFLEGDDMHSPENIAKMHAGIALTTADRMPWLHAIGEWVDARIAADEPATVSCSALMRHYRDLLARERPAVRFVFLTGDPAIIARRLAARKNHFMSPTLLQSQLKTLEPPGADERALTVPLDLTPDEQCDKVIAWLDGYM